VKVTQKPGEMGLRKHKAVGGADWGVVKRDDKKLPIHAGGENRGKDGQNAITY